MKLTEKIESYLNEYEGKCEYCGQKGDKYYVCSNCGSPAINSLSSTRRISIGRGCELCEPCYHDAGKENHHSDNSHPGTHTNCKLCKKELG